MPKVHFASPVTADKGRLGWLIKNARVALMSMGLSQVEPRGESAAAFDCSNERRFLLKFKFAN